MLNELKFVRGGLDKKNFDPTLTHFKIQDGRVWTYNGIICLSCPIACDLDVAPHGVQFLKALNACEDVTTVHTTASGQLSIKSGNFRTLVDCVPSSEHKAPPPAGSFIELSGNLLSAVKTLEPFIGFDASRPHFMGILFKGQSALATNNIIAVEYWLGYDFPIAEGVNIPVQAVRELLRIGEEPLGLQVREDQITFYYTGHRWLTSKLSTLGWPDVPHLLNQLPTEGLGPVVPGFWDAVDKLQPFTDDMTRIHFASGAIRTAKDETATVVELPGVPEVGAFSSAMLTKLRGVADLMDFSQYPRPVPFQGVNVRGMILGLRA